MNKYEEKYKEALEKAKIWQEHLNETGDKDFADELIYIFPELKESEGEKIRKEILEVAKTVVLRDGTLYGKKYNCREWIAWLEKLKVFAEHGAGLYYFGNSSFTYIGSPIWDNDSWLEKQGSEPNWCHHKVDLSNCSEEYRKAYYDGWNNCNQQHSQCKSDGNYVVKCLINGMKFYYEGNEEATWGTEKFPMKVKDILSWLEKQGEQEHTLDIEIPFGAKDSELQEATYLIPEGFHAEIEGDKVVIKKGKQKSAWSKEDEWKFSDILALLRGGENCHYNTPDLFDWFKSLKNRIKGE